MARKQKEEPDTGVKVTFSTGLTISKTSDGIWPGQYVSMSGPDEAERVAAELVAAAAKWRLAR